MPNDEAYVHNDSSDKDQTGAERNGLPPWRARRPETRRRRRLRLLDLRKPSLPKNISEPTKKVGMPKPPRSTAAVILSATFAHGA